MEPVRGPFQGIWNIVRFNWHFYVLSATLVLLIFVLSHYLNEPYALLGNILCVIIAITTLISLIVSFYVYDVSGLYKLAWLKDVPVSAGSKIININAGFDETSVLLKGKYPKADLSVFDFYNPQTHTEVSIKRARQAYPPYPGTKMIQTASVPMEDGSTDYVFVILAAHEIRNAAERVVFFKELTRALKPSGKIVVTEHLRDLPNFLAYTIGFFHFLPKAWWYSTFTNAGLTVSNEIKITPFITTFILEKHGASS